MTDIVDRLRFLSAMIQNSERLVWGSDSAAMDEAATEIERLREEVKQARAEALEEAATVAECAPYKRDAMICGCSEGLAAFTAESIRALIDKEEVKQARVEGMRVGYLLGFNASTFGYNSESTPEAETLDWWLEEREAAIRNIIDKEAGR